MIRSIICKRYKISNQDIKYNYNKYGKPDWIGDRCFYFNISHSGDWIVCIVGNNSVGIDIEHMSNRVRINFTIIFNGRRGFEFKGINRKK